LTALVSGRVFGDEGPSRDARVGSSILEYHERGGNRTSCATRSRGRPRARIMPMRKGLWGEAMGPSDLESGVWRSRDASEGDDGDQGVTGDERGCQRLQPGSTMDRPLTGVWRSGGCTHERAIGQHGHVLDENDLAVVSLFCRGRLTGPPDEGFLSKRRLSIQARTAANRHGPLSTPPAARNQGAWTAAAPRPFCWNTPRPTTTRCPPSRHRKRAATDVAPVPSSGGPEKASENPIQPEQAVLH